MELKIKVHCKPRIEFGVSCSFRVDIDSDDIDIIAFLSEE